MSWRKEFPVDYRPPFEILEAVDIVDVSWGNDVCPSFTTKELAELPVPEGEDPYDLRLWSEHPEFEMRENGAKYRFAVVDITKDKVRWEGDDPVLAVTALKLWSAAVMFEHGVRALEIPEGSVLGESRR